MKGPILLTILFPIIFIGISLQAQINTKVNLSFENKVPSWLAENDVPAVGIGLIENGKIKYVKVFGELKKGIPAPDNTIFGVASLTKPVVAMLTLKLVNAGQWDLDEPLFHYWVDPDVANDPRHKKLNTRIVLRHQTGFPNWRNNEKLAFKFEPGTDTQYSGEGFEYLRHALENKFNQSLVKLSDSLLFTPLGMKDTRFYWDKNIDTSRFAFFHNFEEELYERFTPVDNGISEVNSAASLLTTIEDYCKFGIDVMNGAGLSEKLFNDMISTQVKDQGLCWSIIKDLPDGEYVLEHGGSSNGIKTQAIFLPKSKRGLVVFTNGDNGAAVINNVIIESVDIGETLVDSIFGIHDTSEIVSLSDEILEKYVGTYKNEDGELFTVEKKPGVLRIRIVSGAAPKVTYYPETETKFFSKYEDIQIEFLKNDIGQIARMTIRQHGQILFDTKKINQN